MTPDETVAARLRTDGLLPDGGNADADTDKREAGPGGVLIIDHVVGRTGNTASADRSWTHDATYKMTLLEGTSEFTVFTLLVVKDFILRISLGG